MAYTQTDLDAVTAAILSLATGGRPVQVSIAGKMIRYSEASLNALYILRDAIRVELGQEVFSRRTYARNGGRATVA